MLHDFLLVLVEGSYDIILLPLPACLLWLGALLEEVHASSLFLYVTICKYIYGTYLGVEWDLVQLVDPFISCKDRLLPLLLCNPTSPLLICMLEQLL